MFFMRTIIIIIKTKRERERERERERDGESKFCKFLSIASHRSDYAKFVISKVMY